MKIKKHGDCLRSGRTHLYRIWNNMRQRCNNPKKPCYPYYGGQGVSVCAIWDDYQEFKTWALSSGYAPNLSIDRYPDTTGNYEPNNCRWSTKTAQSRNQKAYENCSSKYRGVTWNKTNKKWMAQISIKNRNQYIGQYLDEVSAAKARDQFIRENKLKHFIMNFQE